MPAAKLNMHAVKGKGDVWDLLLHDGQEGYWKAWTASSYTMTDEKTWDDDDDDGALIMGSL